MTTCNLGFDHPEPEPPVVVEEAPDTEPVADAAVEIARIEADRDVEVARIENRAADEDALAQLAALQAENEALRAQLAPPAEEQQEQAVVVVPEPAPEPEPPAEEPPPPAETAGGSETPGPAPKKRSNPWWR